MKKKVARPELHRDDVAPSLWRRFEKSHEFQKLKYTESISSVHPLVKAAESMGLTKVIKTFIGGLVQEPSLREKYQERSGLDWVDEWKMMHRTLFKGVYKVTGSTRGKGHEVRFGAPGDEEKHKIPMGGPQTLAELTGLGKDISERLKYVDSEDVDNVCAFLAFTHYTFIRIHPFGDGNGRIARALTDQLALSLGYPPIIAGFPRLNSERKNKYHQAITGCINDPLCSTLKTWIKEQIVVKIREIA
jgi:Fic family protein